MLTIKQKWLRFLGGLALVLAEAALGFAVLAPRFYTWGATPAELSAAYPGDDLLREHDLTWTHGMTINAPPQQVWPWIAQMGDQRAAFYSFTFVENLFTIGQAEKYRNANRIVPEWQNPAPGERFIYPMMVIRAVQPGEWLLAGPAMPELGWSWLWKITPQGADQTRLVVRMHIDFPPGMPRWVGSIVNLTFFMEQRMLQGIRLRAEGGVEPPYAQPLEVLLWLAALAAGLVCGWRVVFRPAWKLPLAVGMLAVAALFVLTFIQPALWLRGVIVLLLWLAAVYCIKKES